MSLQVDSVIPTVSQATCLANGDHPRVRADSSIKRARDPIQQQTLTTYYSLLKLIHASLGTRQIHS